MRTGNLFANLLCCTHLHKKKNLVLVQEIEVLIPIANYTDTSHRNLDLPDAGTRYYGSVNSQRDVSTDSQNHDEETNSVHCTTF